MADVTPNLLRPEVPSKAAGRPPNGRVETVVAGGPTAIVQIEREGVWSLGEAGVEEVATVDDGARGEASVPESARQSRVRRGTLEPGTVIEGRYRVEGFPRAQGYVVVAPGRDIGLELAVDVISIAPAHQAHAAIAGRFHREAQLAARVRGARVARVLAVGWLEPGVPYAVVEGCGAPRLDDVLAVRGALPIEDAYAWATQVAEAVTDLHKAGLVHGALVARAFRVEPAPEGKASVRLVDVVAPAFGIDEPWTLLPSAIGHLAPEVLIGVASPDARADVWSFGALLYLMLTGVPAFSGPTPAATLVAATSQPMPSLRTRRAEVPQALEAVVARCLAKDPADRYPTMSAAGEALAASRARVSATVALPVVDAPSKGVVTTAVADAGSKGVVSAAVLDAPSTRVASRARSRSSAPRLAFGVLGLMVGVVLGLAAGFARMDAKHLPSPTTAVPPPARPAREIVKAAEEPPPGPAPAAPATAVAATPPPVAESPRPPVARPSEPPKPERMRSARRVAASDSASPADLFDAPKPAIPTASNLFDDVK